MMAGFTPASAISPATTKVNSGSGDPKVSKGRSQTSSVFIALWSRPQARNPCLRKRAALVVRPATWSRPFGATICKLWVERLGGASAEAQSYWQGRFAACTFVGGFLGVGRTRNSWGVAPNPSRDAVPAPCKGHCPLTLFWRPGLSVLPMLCPAGGFCPFLPLPYWNRDIISCGESPPTMDSPGLISWSNSAFFRCPSATTCSSIEACVTRRITSTLRVCPMRYARSVA